MLLQLCSCLNAVLFDCWGDCWLLLAGCCCTTQRLLAAAAPPSHNQAATQNMRHPMNFKAPKDLWVRHPMDFRVPLHLCLGSPGAILRRPSKFTKSAKYTVFFNSESILNQFWINFESILINFGSILNQFWIYLRTCMQPLHQFHISFHTSVIFDIYCQCIHLHHPTLTLARHHWKAPKAMSLMRWMLPHGGLRFRSGGEPSMFQMIMLHGPCSKWRFVAWIWHQKSARNQKFIRINWKQTGNRFKIDLESKKHQI